jgi:hypothetical protein
VKVHKYRVGQYLKLRATKSSSDNLKQHHGEIVTIKALCPFTFAYELEELPGLWHENCFKGVKQ